jgi:hypothetical protein
MLSNQAFCFNPTTWLILIRLSPVGCDSNIYICRYLFLCFHLFQDLASICMKSHFHFNFQHISSAIFWLVKFSKLAKVKHCSWQFIWQNDMFKSTISVWLLMNPSLLFAHSFSFGNAASAEAEAARPCKLQKKWTKLWYAAKI